MSHPISTSMEYIKTVKHPPYYEEGVYKEDNKERGYESEDYQLNNDSENRWHNILRKMSINIQRDEGTPDRDIVTGTAANPSDHERALMLNIPHSDGSEIGETLEDVDLPTVEECVTENVVDSLPTATNYFENPFESDATSNDDTLVKQNDDNHIHPLSTAINNKSKSHGTQFTSSPEELVQADTTQG
jgi:hypothetical protein